MSQSPLEAGAEADPYHAGWAAISRLLRRGFSWSGHERDVALSNVGGWAQGSGRFVDVSGASGLDFDQDGRAAGRVDWDFDGDVDLVVTSRSGPRVRVLRNGQASDNHWLALQLVGERPNVDAIGARIELTLEGGERERLVATRRAGEGFLAQSSGWVHLGLGAGTPARLRVRWPGGDWERFENVRADRQLVLVQGSGRARAWPAPSTPELAPGPARPAPVDAGTTRLVTRAPLPLPSLTFEADGQVATFFGVLPDAQGRGTGRPALLVLFSHTCAPCAAELAAFAERAEDYASAQVDVVALSVDPTEEREQVRAFVERTGFAGTVAFATQDTLDRLDALQAALLDRDARMPVPTSFLIDPGGMLHVVYLGAVDPRQALNDCRLFGLASPARRLAALPLPGRFLAPRERVDLDWLEGAFERRGLPRAASEVQIGRVQTREVDEARLQTDFGMARLQQERFEDARQHFERALELDPSSARAWKGLGYCHHRVNELEAARDAYLAAARYDPGDERNQVNLGMVYHALGDEDGVQRVRAWLTARRSELLGTFEERVGG